MKTTALRIVLSCFLAALACSCSEEEPAPTSTMPPAAPALVESVDVGKPPPCGIWFGGSALEADARSVANPKTPDGAFWTSGYSTCVDAILACSAAHQQNPGRFCQVRYLDSGFQANGIGTSPSNPNPMPWGGIIVGGGADDDPGR